MAIDLKGLRVFISSPSDLSVERDEIDSQFATFNQIHAVDRGLWFISVRWEDLAAGLGVQERINEKLRECDFAIVMLAGRWGTPPAGEHSAASGSYIEYCETLRCLADEESPMRDIFVAFRGATAAQLEDPTRDFRKILRFKEKLEDDGKLTYTVFDSIEELTAQIHKSLAGWIPKSIGPKQSVHIDPPDLDALFEGLDEGERDPSVLLKKAREYEQVGKITQAEFAYARAASTNTIESLTPYAKFLRRRGRLTRAIEINEMLLELVAVDDSTAGRTTKVNTLANLGVIRRKQGCMAESKRLLTESIATARERDSRDGVMAYALDNLGITLARLGDIDEALEAHSEACEIHQVLGNTRAKAKSSINVARLLITNGDFGEAEDLLAESIDALAENSESDRANALVAVGQLYIATERADEAREVILQALSINEAIGHMTGIAVAQGQLSRVERLAHSFDAAVALATQSVRTNEKSGNREGRVIALRLLGEALIDADHQDEAQSHLSEGLRLAREQGIPRETDAVSDLLRQLDDA